MRQFGRVTAAGAAFFLGITALPAWSAGAEPSWDLTVPKEVHVTTLLAPFEAKPIGQPETIAFDVDPSGNAAVIDGSSIRVLGSTDRLVALGVESIEDFAWMRDGALMLVTQGHLAALTPKGVFPSLSLPNPRMQIRPAGENSAYLFGGSVEPSNHDVFLFTRDGAITKLATLPLSVSAVAGDGITTYIAAGRTVVRLAWNEPLSVIFEADAPLVSLEIGPRVGLFFSTASSVGYVAGDGVAYEFLRGQGGTLRARGAALYLLSLDRTQLLRFMPLEGFETVIPHGREPPPNIATAGPGGASQSYAIAGQWHWRVDCGIGGGWHGSFQFDEPSNNRFNGLVTANMPEPGMAAQIGACPTPIRIRQGHIKGANVSFIKESCEGARPQRWKGTLVRGSDHLLHMSGTATGDSSKLVPFVRDWQCSWTASQSKTESARSSGQ